MRLKAVQHIIIFFNMNNMFPRKNEHISSLKYSTDIKPQESINEKKKKGIYSSGLNPPLS